tara:strand:- start:156 stop:296 length:141 start_codon:yes stop_codon:yes gene_type:complete
MYNKKANVASYSFINIAVNKKKILVKKYEIFKIFDKSFMYPLFINI